MCEGKYVITQPDGSQTDMVFKDPVCGMMVDEERTQFETELNGRNFYFCCGSCKKAFDKDPFRYGQANRA